MSEIEQTMNGRDVGLQACFPCGDDAACLVMASADLRRRSHDLNRHMAPSPFALSGALRVQWTSLAHVMRLRYARRVT
jgi:hypothetical protein